MTGKSQIPADQDTPADFAVHDELFATLYKELHAIAHRALSRKDRPLSMSTTVLLHELYLSLAGREGVSFPDQRRFLAYAARAIRGVTIDAIRRRQAFKRGSAFHITRLDTNCAEEIPDEEQITRLDAALEELAQVEPSLAELVDLKYFCGLTLTEIGALRGVGERTMQREWRKAKMLLFDLLTETDSD